MSINISGKNRLQLWRLAMVGGAEWPGLMKPPMDSATERDMMIEAGLLSLTKEIPDPEAFKAIRAASGRGAKAPDGANAKTRAKPAAPRAINRLRLTAKGREYLLEHLGEPVSHLSPNSGPILSWVLSELGKSGNGKAAMAAILLGQAAPALTPEGLLEELRGFGPELFMPGGGLRISVIKRRLKEHTPEAIDKAIIELQKRGMAILSHFDDPLRVTQEDKELGLKVSGVIRHYLYLK